MHDETWAKPLETSRSRSRSREMRKIWTKLSRIGILGGGGTGDKREASGKRLIRFPRSGGSFEQLSVYSSIDNFRWKRKGIYFTVIKSFHTRVLYTWPEHEEIPN